MLPFISFIVGYALGGLSVTALIYYAIFIRGTRS